MVSIKALFTLIIITIFCLTVRSQDIYDQVFAGSVTTGSGWIYMDQNDDYIFFAAGTNTTGRELWRSDGTPDGTTLVRDINPSNSSNPQGPSSTLIVTAVVDNTLYFMANDGTNGRELWKSDGTETGTVLVKDIWPGTNWGAESEYLVEFNGGVAFEGRDDNGIELWISDGTEAGTVMVKDIRSGSESSFARYLEEMNGELFFFATEGSVFSLWKSDGTEMGTEKLIDLGAESNPEYITTYNGSIIFYNWTASDPTKDELWISDGTVAGTSKITDTNSSGPINEKMTQAGNDLFFRAGDNDAGIELYKTNGTASGSRLVKDLTADSGDGFPENFIEYNGEIYFASGNDIWKSDGTNAGTIKVVEGVNNRTKILSDGANLYYLINDNLGIYNTEDGSQEIETSPDFYVIDLLAVFQGEVYFIGGEDQDDSELWKYDPSDASATLSIDSQPSNLDACAGDNGSFAMEASGSTNLIYQWQEDQGNGFVDLSNDSDISGATTATLQLTSLSVTMDARQYRCVISGDNADDITSEAAKLNVSVIPEIVSQPSSQSLNTGETATFTVSVSGNNLTYQWQKGEEDITGATSSTLQLTSVQSFNSGTFKCRISNACATLFSASALLLIDVPLDVSSNIDQPLIYPNPAVDHFTLKLPDGDWDSYSVRISDLSGKQIYHRFVESLEKELVVKTNDVAKGTYLISILSDTKLIVATTVIIQ